METQSLNNATALEFLRCAFALEADKAVAMLCEDATWWVAGDPDKIRIAGLRDRRRILSMLKNLSNSFPSGMEYVIKGVTAEGERVAIEAEAKALWRDDGWYQNSYHFLVVIRDGKIQAVREYMDTLQVYLLAH